MRKCSFLANERVYDVVEYLEQHKIEGCDRKQSVARHFSLKIPESEQIGGSNLSHSICAKDFKCEYFLRCFVKYNSIFEIGQGTCVEFPIKILPQPIECEKTDDFDPTYKVTENLAILNFEESKNLRKDFW